MLLCLSPLAIPLLPVLLVYWFREKRAGRPVSFRWRFGNESAVQPTLEETSEPEVHPEPVHRDETSAKRYPVDA